MDFFTFSVYFNIPADSSLGIFVCKIYTNGFTFGSTSNFGIENAVQSYLKKNSSMMDNTDNN